MKIEQLFLFAVALVIGLTLRTTAHSHVTAEPLVGVWLNEDQNKKITFTQMTDHTFTATVTWVKTGTSSNIHVGDVVVKDLKGSGSNYSGGQLYAVKRGRWVNGSAYLVNLQTLELKGSIGLVSQTQVWTRSTTE